MPSEGMLHPDVQAWLDRCNTELRPMIEGSALSLTIITNGPPDAKLAVELGFSILLGKPLVFVVSPDVVLPERMARLADHIIEVDLRGADGPAVVQREIAAFLRRMGL